MKEKRVRVAVVLGISDKRDEELRILTLGLIERTKDMSEFLYELERDNDISMIEKLYIATQYGRIQALFGNRDINTSYDIPYIS